MYMLQSASVDFVVFPSSSFAEFAGRIKTPVNFKSTLTQHQCYEQTSYTVSLGYVCPRLHIQWSIDLNLQAKH